MNLAELLDTLTAEHVHVAFIPTPRPGAWYHRERLIVIDSGLTPVTQKCVLAHELVHVVRDDKGPQREAVEVLVNREAARLLISPSEYALAERVYGPNCYCLAEELSVTENTIRSYQSLLETAA